jgi:hypothetical protein
MKANKYKVFVKKTKESYGQGLVEVNMYRMVISSQESPDPGKLSPLQGLPETHKSLSPSPRNRGSVYKSSGRKIQPDDDDIADPDADRTEGVCQSCKT